MNPRSDHEPPAAIVTGGTGGLGRAAAMALAAAGYRITVTGLLAEDVLACQQAHPDWEVVSLDVRDATAVESLLAPRDRLDALVHCAGMILRSGAEFQLAGFEQVIDVNLLGTMRVCLAARAALSRAGGAVVNIASMLSQFGSGLSPAYSSSKGGVVQLTRSLAIAWAPQRIRVNAVAPGWIRTSLTQPLWDDPERSRPIIARTPLGRWGEPADVAGAIVFLCSTRAAFITGATLPVDGGYSIA